MRKDPLVNDRYYHIYNRGVDKRDIFIGKKDLERFILSIKAFNDIKPARSIKDLSFQDLSDVGRPTPLVAIVCYCINPNHFHFIIKQEVDGGISEFFKRLLGGYTKYFNKMYNRSGALFQGRFKSCIINDDAYILKIRPYVNMNYMIHDIPKEKSHLIMASDKEYDNLNFNLVNKKEAEELLNFYGDNIKFKNECLQVIEMIRKERGKTSLQEEDLLP